MEIIRVGDYLDTLTDYHANGSYKVLKANVNLLDEENYAVMVRTLNFERDDFSDLKYIDQHAYEFLGKSKVYPDDILMNKIANPGSIYIMPNLNRPVSCGMNLFLLRFNNKLNQRYMYYCMKNSEAYIKSFAHGTATKTITKKEVMNLLLRIHPRNEQDKIAAFLDKIQQKIDINQSVNENLAAQAQAIFKDWFIDTPDSVSWPSGTFSDIIENMIAGDWGKESPTGNNTEMVYCIRGADIPDVKNGNKGKMPTRFILPKNYAAKHLVAGDVVVEISGGSPTQSTGRIASISQSLLDRYDKGMVCTNFCKAMKPKVGYSMFVYYYWQYLYDRNVFFSYENGTTGIKNLDISGFIETEPIVLPPTELIAKFDALCHSMFDVIFANGLQNEQLANIRDSLLPKLMSGELDVSELDI